MKRTIIKLLKIIFILLAVALAVLITFGAVYAFDWPWWVGIFILLGFVGLAIGILFLRKLWLRRQEQHFVNKMIEQDESQLRELAEKEKAQGKELQDRWKEAIESLRKSHLKKRGNPLYVLPWYLVIGESGSGKTTAIQSARLASPFSEVNRISGISGTRNCEWWFFEQAILIDTAGRYTIRMDEERDKAEWQKFLSLLAKYRQKEPLNGVIVSLPAEKALSGSPEALEQDGHEVRRRIDELMRVLGAKFPVYLLVTKCDLVQGMTQFCDQLPEKTLNQAMGFLNTDFSRDANAFLDQTFETTGERLRDLRLQLLHQAGSKNVDPSLLLFPEEFEKLKGGLASFMKGAFRENPYQETPLFRGFFFSSGRQEGSPYSHFLKALGLIEEKDVLPGTNRGLFLHDFFSKVLPKDRSLFAPTKGSLEWSRITRNMGLTSWIALGLALCGLLSFAFVKNIRALRWVTHEFSQRPEAKGEHLRDLEAMDRFRAAILKVEEQNRNWIIPRFRLHQSRYAEIALKEYYCTQFQKNFLGPFDELIAARMSRFTPGVADEVLGQHVSHLARRINLLKARLSGSGLGSLESKPQPQYDPNLPLGDRAMKAAPVKDLFATQYLYYLVWRLDSSRLENETATLQKWLDQMLALKPDIHWLAGWADAQPFLSAVNLETFWGGSQPSKAEARISPAYTRKGKEQIDALLREMETAVTAPQALTRSRQEFAPWYAQEYIRSWHDFAVVLPKGSERLKGRDEWQVVAAKVKGLEGPYFAFLDRAANELEPFVAESNQPPWLKLIFQFQLMKFQIANEEMAQDKSILGKAAEKGKQLVGDIERGLGKLGAQQFESQAKAVQAYVEYSKALAALTPVSASRKLAFEITGQVFSQDEVTGQSPFFSAAKAQGLLKNAMSKANPAEAPFWGVMNGPLDFLWIYMRHETACYLQKQWEEEVLADTHGISDQQVLQRQLLSETGSAWKFVKGSAGAFLSRNIQKGGYYSREVKGQAIPFEPPFLTFLNRGQVAAATLAAAAAAPPAPPAPKPNYAVGLHGLPTDANADASLKPHATRLEVRCDSGVQKLENFNYPCSATINWSPETCHDVTFTIDVGDVSLVRHYEGNMAFPRFLKEFRYGERTYGLKEFPADRAALERLGIRSISVKYKMTGQGAVIDLLGTAQRQPPQVVITPPVRILKCWDR